MTKRIEFCVDHGNDHSTMTAVLWEGEHLIAIQQIERNNATVLECYIDLNIRSHSEYVLALDPTVEINTTPIINDYREEVA